MRINQGCWSPAKWLSFVGNIRWSMLSSLLSFHIKWFELNNTVLCLTTILERQIWDMSFHLSHTEEPNNNVPPITYKEFRMLYSLDHTAVILLPPDPIVSISDTTKGFTTPTTNFLSQSNGLNFQYECLWHNDIHKFLVMFIYGTLCPNLFRSIHLIKWKQSVKKYYATNLTCMI